MPNPAPVTLAVCARGGGRRRAWLVRQRLDPYWRLYRNMTGNWSIEWKGTDFPLPPRRIVLVPPDTPFIGHGEQEADHLFMHVFVFGLPCTYPHRPLSLAMQPGWSALLSQADPSRTALPAWRAHLAGLAVFTQALHAASDAFCPQDLPAPIAAVRHLLDTTLWRAVDSTEMARMAGMHPVSLARAFRACLGCPPKRYHLQRRLDRAAEALAREESTIEAIAEAYGFCDRFHFSRHFAARFGQAPGAWRRQAMMG